VKNCANQWQWTIIYDGFDGSHLEFAGTGIQHPFLTLTNQGGKLVIGTQSPKTISWP
jgi:hypothetical protein